MSGADAKLVVDDLPPFVVGVEHEYKWLLDGRPADATSLPAGSSVDDLLALSGPPAGYDRTARFTVTQSSIYFDEDSWPLAEEDLSLAVVLNHGPLRHIAWLVLKETLVWSGGRRDTLETAAPVDPRRVEEATEDDDLLPVRRLARALGRRPRVRPYACATQLRRKVHFTNRHGTVLALSLDETRTCRPEAALGLLHEHRWLEIESNQSDQASLRDLAAWGAALTQALDLPPHLSTKPAGAAASLGWHGGTCEAGTSAS